MAGIWIGVAVAASMFTLRSQGRDQRQRERDHVIQAVGGPHCLSWQLPNAALDTEGVECS